MTDTPYIIRNYRPDDFDNYVYLRQEMERLEPRGWPVSPEIIAEILAWPDHSPEQNLFVLELDDRLIGYMDMWPEMGIGRVILNAWLRPEHRRKGLATEFLGYAMHRARDLGARVVHVNVMEDNAVAREVLSRLGFQCVRRFLEFKLDMSVLNGSEAERATRGCCHLKHNEEWKLTRIQNRCFTGTWGYNPNTLTTIIYRTHLGHFSPEDVVLAYEGDTVTGYCWTWVIPDRNKGEGRIYMLGTDPDYRGRSLGKKLLLAGLSHLKNKGVGVAVLTVDSENPVACGLYRSVGFEVETSSLWYEKAVLQAL